jgi:hypothetical protein
MGRQLIKMKHTLVHALLVSAVLLAGCATPPPASNPLDPTAKQFQPASGKAGLYLCREGGVASSEMILQAVLDGRKAGLLPTGTYQWITVDPGEHVLMINIQSGEQESLPPGQFKYAEPVTFTARAGENYFFRASLRLGWAKARLNLVPVSNEEGRKDVTASRLAPAPAN